MEKNQTIKNHLIKEYLQPVRIVCQANAERTEQLLSARQTQAHMEYFPIASFDRGFVVLDFGKELCGGLRIVCRSADSGTMVRIRFGESVGECNAELGQKGACNDHAVRDLTLPLPMLSDQEWGKTGFRFARLDFIGKAEIVGVYAASTRYERLPLGSFTCDDPLVNQIYDTAAYTVYLNMQEYIFDGIKRDRMIWVGDMQPEVSAITYLYGQCDLVEKTLREAIDHNPMPGWIVAMPTYSFWLMQIVCDYYQRTGNRAFALECLPYLEQTLALFDRCIDADGNCDFSSVVTVKNPFFVDWPTSASGDEEQGGRFIFRMGVTAMIGLYSLLELPVPPTCDSILRKLDRQGVGTIHSKSTTALGYLTDRIPTETAVAKLSDGANGMTTFMSYFILRAIAQCCGVRKALEVMKEYFGAMLQRGATTFWENFDMAWLENSGRIDELTPEGKKDLHGDFGEYCYQGFRHSLCHGWSCGAVSFLTEKVLGVTFVNAQRISLCPELGDLKYAGGVIPTAYGAVQVEVTRAEGNRLLTVTLPGGRILQSSDGQLQIDLTDE